MQSVSNIVDLIIPFIVLGMISLGAEQATKTLEAIMNRIKGLPDYFEWYIAYIIVVIIGYLFCWQGNWSLFNYLDVNFNYKWQSYLATSLLLSSGSTGVKKVFDMIEAIPNNISGLKSNRINKKIDNKSILNNSMQNTYNDNINNNTYTDNNNNSNNYTGNEFN